MTTPDLDAHPLHPDEEFPPEALPFVPQDDHTGDGYDWMRELPPGWQAVTSWGSEGWTLGDPPYVVAAHYDGQGLGIIFGLAVYIEGDVTVTAYGSRALRNAHTDEFALDAWHQSGNGPRDGLPPTGTPADRIPARFRGPYRPEEDTTMTTPDTTPVELVRAAIAAKEVRHGKHAANLLREHGHDDLAARLDAAVRDRNGHLSARQALTLLENGEL